MTRHNVIPLFPAEAAFTARRIAGNGIYPPSTKDAIQARELAEAAPFWMDENAPHVNTVSFEQPPALAAYRRRMRVRAAREVAAAVVMFALLVVFAILPDSAVVQAQMEDAQ